MSKNSEIMTKILSMITFLPFIGWIFTILFSKNRDDLKKKTNLSFYLAFTFLSAIVFIYMVDIFLPNQFKVVSLILAISHNAIMSVYLLLSLALIVITALDREVNLPFFSKQSEKLKI